MPMKSERTRQLERLVATVYLDGWRFWVCDDEIHFAMLRPPKNNRASGRLTSFDDSFYVPQDWDEDRIVRRLFANLQYLFDHELREQFIVHGRRAFEPHEPSVTGFQKEWFVEHESAVTGYGQ